MATRRIDSRNQIDPRSLSVVSDTPQSYDSSDESEDDAFPKSSLTMGSGLTMEEMRRSSLKKAIANHISATSAAPPNSSFFRGSSVTSDRPSRASRTSSVKRADGQAEVALMQQKSIKNVMMPIKNVMMPSTIEAPVKIERPTPSTKPITTTTSEDTRSTRAETSATVQNDNYDAAAGLLYRRPSYEALGQNELSKSRHRLRAATLPALLRRLTELSISSRDDSWAYLCRARAFTSPVHFVSFAAARFFMDTYRPASQCHPYNVIKAGKGSKNKFGGKGRVGKKAKRRELLHLLNIHPPSQAPASKSGERLWLLKTSHVLGPNLEAGGALSNTSKGGDSRSEEEWQHATLLPVRCAVLSLLDVYLTHWGFDFNNSVAGGVEGSGKENDAMRTEVASCLRQFLVDVADCGALEMWGWSNDTIYKDPETDCPAMFAQFPALSTAVCAAVAADRNTKQTRNKLSLTSEQMERLKRVLKKNPSFVGRTSMETAESVNDSGGGSHFMIDSFATNSAKAIALAISEKCLGVMASQATCIIAAEHRLSSESFRHVHDVAPPKKLLVNSVDKIILAMAIGGPKTSKGIDTSGGDYFTTSTVPPHRGSGHGSSIGNASHSGGNSGERAESGGGEKTGTLFKQTKYTRKWEPRTVTLDTLGKFSWDGGPLHQGFVMLDNDCVASEASDATIGRKYGIIIETLKRKITFACCHESERNGWLSAIAKHTGAGHRITHTLGQKVENVGHDLKKALNTVDTYRRGSMLKNMMGQNTKLPVEVVTGMSMYGPVAVVEQVTLHLFYLYVAIPLREFTLDLSFKHGKIGEETYGQPHLARFRHESERIPGIFVSLILETSTPEGRGKLLAFLVQVCDMLYEMRSYHGFMLILSALQANPIHRLKKSWAFAYGMHYLIEREEDGPESNRSTNNSGRSTEGSSSVVVGVAVNVKEGYTRLLEFAGIGGRNLAQVCHTTLSRLSDNSETNYDENSGSHRISFPDAPRLPVMPFVNASLGTLIRLNELPDEVEVEDRLQEGGDDLLTGGKNAGKKAGGEAGAGGEAAKEKLSKLNLFGRLKRRKEGEEEGTRLLNLSKMRRVAAIIAMLRACQLTPYLFNPRVEVQYQLLKQYMFVDGEDQYQKSLVIEGADYAI